MHNKNKKTNKRIKKNEIKEKKIHIYLRYIKNCKRRAWHDARNPQI